MNKVESNILNIAREVIEKNNFVLVDSVFRGERGSKVFQFFVDGQGDVTADLCAQISREISDLIDEKEPDVKSFRLEVSSPGVDRPLKYLFQYRKHINRKLKVEYEGENGIEKTEGKLASVDDDGNITLLVKKEEIKININKITKANVLISFS
jgi:ribosome maturation factor RimP